MGGLLLQRVGECLSVKCESGWLGKGNVFAQGGEFLPYEHTPTLSEFRAGSEIPTVECGVEN